MQVPSQSQVTVESRRGGRRSRWGKSKRCENPKDVEGGEDPQDEAKEGCENWEAHGRLGAVSRAT